MMPLTPPREPRREATPVGPRSLAWCRENMPAFAELEDRARRAGLLANTEPKEVSRHD